ncbi:MAG: hypothetical protein ACRDJN_06850, partial [Chloroflexota bacterium]
GEPFVLGMFEDFGMVSDDGKMEALVTDLQARGFDAVLFTNGFAAEQDARLRVADRLGFDVYLGPMGELYRDWWHSATPATIEHARSIVYPLVDLLKAHPSLKGYNIVDDATNALQDKIRLAVQAFHERDTVRPAMPVITMSQDEVYPASQPKVLLSYAYPAGATQQPCDFTYPGFRESGANDFVGYIRQVARFKDADVPLWMILQTHGSSKAVDPNAPGGALREPTVEEVRLQNWLALGEDVQGLFWFTYSGIPSEFWTGLKDNAPLYAEVTDLTQRTNALRHVFATTRKTTDQFSVSAGASLPYLNRPYASTLVGADGKHYVVAANRSCGPQTLSITSPTLRGQLKDLETGQLSTLGAGIPFRGGDGKVFELVNASGMAQSATAPVNLLANPSFDATSGGFPADWAPATGGAWDGSVTRSGAGALKMQGPAGGLSYQGLRLKPDTQYSLSFWVKTQNVTGKGISVRHVTTAPMIDHRGTTPAVNGTTNGWVQVTNSFYTPIGAEDGRFDLIWELNSGDVAWIDDVRLCEGMGCMGTSASIAPAPTPPPAPSSTPTPTTTPAPAAPAGVPQMPVSYGMDVETWWATHPFNPENPNSIPVGGIGSPSPRLNVKTQFGGNIQAAIDALPATGGTLFFEPGVYENGFQLTKSNVHFVADSHDAVIRGSSRGS